MITTTDSREEVANTLTHGLGVFASVLASAILIPLVAMHGDPWRIVSASLYSASLILLYSASTLYHASRNERVKRRLEILDHSAIFVLIAGTYTPFTLVSLRGGWGWSLFGVVWGLTVAGVVLKLFFTRRFQLISTLVYVAMGWLVLVALDPLVRALSWPTLALLVAGGLAYTAGTFFYHNQRMRYGHAVWHLFVLGGSMFHFFAVVTQVLPA